MSTATTTTTRILYVNHTGEISGAERVLLQMLQGLDRSIYQPSVLCPDNGPLLGAVGRLGIECNTLDPLQARFTVRPDRIMSYLLSIFNAIIKMRRKIKEVQPDAIHANTVRAGIVTTLASVGMKAPVIWHVHDILPRHPLSIGIRSLAYCSKKTSLLCVSMATAKAFAGAINFGKRIQVLHNGVDLSLFPRKTGKDREFRAELGIATGDFLVCAVGQIAPRKQLRELIEAFAQITDQSPAMHLAIVGKAIFNKDHEYRDYLVNLVSRLGLSSKVHFTGGRNDVGMVLRSADILVLNSLQEPFGLVLVESMSSGTAVVATPVGGIPEIVTDGVTGWLIENDRLAELLVYLAQNPHLLLAAQNAAVETVCPYFSLSRFLTHLHLFYKDLGLCPRSRLSMAELT